MKVWASRMHRDASGHFCIFISEPLYRKLFIIYIYNILFWVPALGQREGGGMSRTGILAKSVDWDAPEYCGILIRPVSRHFWPCGSWSTDGGQNRITNVSWLWLWLWQWHRKKCESWRVRWPWIPAGRQATACPIFNISFWNSIISILVFVSIISVFIISFRPHK